MAVRVRVGPGGVGGGTGGGDQAGRLEQSGRTHHPRAEPLGDAVDCLFGAAPVGCGVIEQELPGSGRLVDQTGHPDPHQPDRARCSPRAWNNRAASV